MITSSYCELYLRSITKVKHNLENSFGREAEVLAVYVVACKLSLEDILSTGNQNRLEKVILVTTLCCFLDVDSWPSMAGCRVERKKSSASMSECL